MVKIAAIFILVINLFAYQKTPSDVYSYAMIIKKTVEKLREENGIYSPFPQVAKQKNKYPRHVLQKAIEILNKINQYRKIHKMGEIYIPPYPIRDITPNEVYETVKMVEANLIPLIRDKLFLESLRLKKYVNKTPNDVYRLLWSISLAFDEMLGIRGYTPNDVYKLSEVIVKNALFLRQMQNIYDSIKKPKYSDEFYPNHALYRSYKFLRKVRIAEENLWIDPTEVPVEPKHVVTPTEVYDSLQYNLAEIQRIKYRLGVERYFKEPVLKENKSSKDVVENLDWAAMLLPVFGFSRELIQYPKSSLQKTPNHVFALTEEIKNKIIKLKNLKGIKQIAKEPPYIYGLKPMHAYQKAIEATEKALRLKKQMGFYPSYIPQTPLRKITPNEVYSLVLRLDGIVTQLLERMGEKSELYIYKLNKKIPSNKTPSDVYNNLWKISNEFDVILAGEYTPNETFALAEVIEEKTLKALRRLRISKEAINRVLSQKIEVENKTPKDVFLYVQKLFSLIKNIQKRLNIEYSNVIIPVEKNITPSVVYNALRILNASVNELLINLKVPEDNIIYKNRHYIGKTPTDVYLLVRRIYKLNQLLFNESNYED